MKGVGRSDEFLSSEENCEVKLVVYSINRTLPNAFFVYKTLNRNRNTKYKKVSA
jgi:hypothetical protein